MESIVPKHLIELLTSSIVLSVILMSLIQKFKTLTFIKKSWQIWFLNLIFSFLLGIPFAITFYNFTFIDGLWVSLLSFIGASSIYEALKNQKLINYTPTSVTDSITISKSNEIKRDDA